MQNLKLIAFFTFLSILIVSCGRNNEDVTESVNKSGSIETAVHIEHVDTLHDELITTHKVWVKHDLYRTVVYRDTIPALGIETRVAENEEGDTKNVSVKKDYEIYITVK